MKQLKAGKSGPLTPASAEFVTALMEKRVSEGTIERPDIAQPADTAKVEVKVYAPKVDAYLQRCKKAGS